MLLKCMGVAKPSKIDHATDRCIKMERIVSLGLKVKGRECMAAIATTRIPWASRVLMVRDGAFLLWALGDSITYTNSPHFVDEETWVSVETPRVAKWYS